MCLHGFSGCFQQPQHTDVCLSTWSYDDLVTSDLGCNPAFASTQLGYWKPSDPKLISRSMFTTFPYVLLLGDESHIGQTALLDMSLQSLSYYDGFGEEDKGYDLLGNVCILFRGAFDTF